MPGDRKNTDGLPPFDPEQYDLQRDPGETDEEFARRKALFEQPPAPGGKQ